MPARRTTFLALLVADGLALCSSVVIGVVLLELYRRQHGLGVRLTGELVFVPAFLVALALHGAYAENHQQLIPSLGSGLRKLFQALATGILLAMAMDAVLRGLVDGHRDLFVTEAVALALPALLLLPAFRSATLRLLRGRSPAVTRVVIVGAGRVGASVRTRLSLCADAVVVGVVDDNPLFGDDLIGSIGDLPAICRRLRVDRVLVAFPSMPQGHLLDCLRLVGPETVVSIVPRFYELVTWRSQIEELAGVPLVHVAPAQLAVSARWAKAAFDRIVAATSLLVLSPLFAAVAVAIKVSSPGPVFFRQQRTGLHGEAFPIFKFRTMHAGAEDRRSELAKRNEVDGPIFKLREDPRVTRVGSFLRKTSIDELPQLLNVVRGEMSMVGPRPFPVAESAQITGFATSRFNVKPGITGLWQVSGRSNLSYDDLCHLDSIYVSSWSLWWDVRILLQTPSRVLRQQGAC
ncbi:MAG: sugar transferase [Acidimicrobiales bacterium]